MASLASTTSTRADTAARHMQACRVNYEHLKSLTGKDENEFITNKYKYCLHKDELAVSVTKKMFSDGITASAKYPYPSVVSTLGSLAPEVRRFICWANHISSLPNYDTLVVRQKDALAGRHPEIAQLSEYVPVGYSVGLAFAHSASGDNVASVMIGGVVTVRNGHFEMFTGDMVQFYWDFEHVMFNEKGERLEDAVPAAGAGAAAPPAHLPGGRVAYAAAAAYAQVPEDFTDIENIPDPTALTATERDQKRQRYYSKQQNGMDKGTQKECIPMVKPYIRHKGKQVFADNNRVFGKCISHARPFDMVDILICRQAM